MERIERTPESMIADLKAAGLRAWIETGGWAYGQICGNCQSVARVAGSPEVVAELLAREIAKAHAYTRRVLFGTIEHDVMPDGRETWIAVYQPARLDVFEDLTELLHRDVNEYIDRFARKLETSAPAPQTAFGRNVQTVLDGNRHVVLVASDLDEAARQLRLRCSWDAYKNRESRIAWIQDTTEEAKAGTAEIHWWNHPHRRAVGLFSNLPGDRYDRVYVATRAPLDAPAIAWLMSNQVKGRLAEGGRMVVLSPSASAHLPGFAHWAV